MHPQQQTKRVGSTATFTCQLRVREFTFNGGVLPSNARRINRDLKIRNISKDNQGVYQCLGDVYLNDMHYVLVEAYGILNVSG